MSVNYLKLLKPVLCLTVITVATLAVTARAADYSGNTSSSGIVQPNNDISSPVVTTSDISPSNRMLLSSDTNTGMDFQSKQTGRFPVHFGLALSGYYDDNIDTQKTNKQSDFITTITPFISWNTAADSGAENSFQLYYAPTYERFLDKTSNDTLDQYGTLGFYHNGDKTTFSLTQSVTDSNSNSFDVADRVNHQDYATQFNLNYQLTGKTSISVAAAQTISVYQQGYNSNDWNISSYLNYQMLPKVTVGVGGLIGYADISGPNQTYEQANVQATYVPTAKTSLYGVVGAEFRQTEQGGSTETTPDFSFGANWQPFDGTNLNINASRSFDYSNKFAGTDYIDTGISGSLSQRFIQQIYGTIALSYANAAYQSNSNSGSGGLNYNFYSIKPSLSYQPVEWCNLGVFYQYRENVTSSSNAFKDNQVGFNATFQY